MATGFAKRFLLSAVAGSVGYIIGTLLRPAPPEIGNMLSVFLGAYILSNLYLDALCYLLIDHKPNGFNFPRWGAFMGIIASWITKGWIIGTLIGPSNPTAGLVLGLLGVLAFTLVAIIISDTATRRRQSDKSPPPISRQKLE